MCIGSSSGWLSDPVPSTLCCRHVEKEAYKDGRVGMGDFYNGKGRSCIPPGVSHELHSLLASSWGQLIGGTDRVSEAQRREGSSTYSSIPLQPPPCRNDLFVAALVTWLWFAQLSVSLCLSSLRAEQQWLSTHPFLIPSHYLLVS